MYTEEEELVFDNFDWHGINEADSKELFALMRAVTLVFDPTNTYQV